ncbi:MAG: NUDIX hydrolase [Flavobacteriales bacterium]|nr:NUDIX hydrolase [Flavobacteriales bacterium]
MRISVDIVLFGYRKSLQILLIRRKFEPFKGEWALPGGFVLEDESLEQAVLRELKEETGVEMALSRLEQIYTFGAVDRDPRERVISVAYIGLVNPDKFQLLADTDAADAQWFELVESPQLAFDHQEILDLAQKRLQGRLVYSPIGFDLLPEKFLFSEVEDLYQSILNIELDRRNFRKKFLGLGLLEETGERVSEGKGRPAMLYRFNKKVYEQLEKEKINLQLLG